MIVQNEPNPAQLSIRSSGAARLRAWARSAPEWKIRRTRNFFEVEDVQPAARVQNEAKSRATNASC